MTNVVVTAEKIVGCCSANISLGDKMVFEESNLNLLKTTKVCPFALATLYPLIFAARLGHDLAEIGLKERLVQCIDPGPPFSDGGTVLWKIVPDL